MDKKSKLGYEWAFVFVAVLALIGIYAGDIKDLPSGFMKIVFANDILISDYFAIAGVGPTFMNVAVVTLTTVLLMLINKIPIQSGSIMTIGLMAGFSFFGKNFFNMWFIIAGTYLFCFVKKEKFSKYLIISFLSTALGPLISTTFFSGGMSFKSVMTSITCGIIIGFVMPMLASYTDRISHGLNLYNGGFAIGLLTMIMVPILKSYGFEFIPVNHWAVGYNPTVGFSLYVTSMILIIGGYLEDPENAFTNYRNILKRPGNPKDDFIVLDGMGAVLINMGVNCAIATTYIIVAGGNLNGPTLGGIFTIMGFSAKGKHALNIIPILIGVAIGGITKQWTPMAPTAQLAALFGTTLAPVAGTYGALAGIAAGFIHSSVVLHVGQGYSGVNLYNNGFAGGITSMVMYSVLSSFMKPKIYSEPSESIMKKKEEDDKKRMLEY